MTRPPLGPAWAIALAGLVASALLPAALTAQRVTRVRTVEITPADAQIQVGQTQVFLATAYDVRNAVIGNATYAFSSSRPDVASVDANGIAVGVGPGVAYISVQTGTGAQAKRARATLTVVSSGAVAPQAAVPAPTPAPRAVPSRPAGPGSAALEHQEQGTGQALGLVVTPRQATLVRGEYFTLRYQAMNANGELAERVPLLFEVEESGRHVLAVDSVGVVRAIGDTGATLVRIVVPSGSNPNNIQPRIAEVRVLGDSVAFGHAEMWVTVGEVDTLPLVVPAQAGRAFSAPPGHFQFESSDETKVRVNAILPVFTALSPGVARVSGAGSAFYHPSVTVHVVPPVVAFQASPPEHTITLAMRATTTVRATPLAADSSVASGARISWTLPDSTIARFDTATGTLHGVGMGETRLAVSAPLSRDSASIVVWRIRVVAGGLAASRTRLGVGVGDRTPVQVQLLDDRRRPIGPAADLRWQAVPDSVARYADGDVEGLRPGRTRLTARTPWDSTVAIDVFTAAPLLASVRRGGRWDLYALTADSAPLIFPVTADASVEQDPAWAPDLTRIAYVAAPPDRPTSPELWVANADGSEATRLTFDSAVVGGPAFVPPDGDRIVFHSNRGGRLQLYVINRDGTGRRQITSGENPSSGASVSADGRRILFVSLQQPPGGGPRNYDIFEMNADGTGERRLTTSTRTDDTPRYASDGRSFFFLRDDGGNPPTKRVYRQSLSDTTAQALTPPGLFVRSYAVDADGRRFVLSWLESQRGNDVAHVALFDAATGALTPIALGAGDQLATPVFRPPTPAAPR